MSKQCQIVINLVLMVMLGANLLAFGRLSAGIGHLCDRLAAVTDQTKGMQTTATASGNVVTVESPRPELPTGPRTVEQIALYLGVTPDTVRDSYIPDWIEQGLMTERDRVRNRWLVPGSFDPYRTR